MRKRIFSLLIKMGVRSGYKGFSYIVDIVDMMIADSKTTNLCDYAYPTISEKYGVGLASIERCIRYCIETADKEMNAYKEVIGTNEIVQVKRFLMAIYNYIKEDMDIED